MVTNEHQPKARSAWPTIRIGQRELQILFAALFLLVTRIWFDITSAANYVYPESVFGASVPLALLFLVGLPGVIIFSVVRFFQRRFIEGFALAAILYIPFSFNEIVDRHNWKFR